MLFENDSNFSKPNIESKTSCAKVVMLSMLFDIITKKVKVKFSFAQKAIILLLSKVNIKSKNLFYKIWSVWYAI